MRLGVWSCISRESTIYWSSILVRVNVPSTGININGMDSQDDQRVETQVIGPEILSKNLKGVERAVLTKCLSKFYITGWSCFVNVEDMEYLQI